MNWDPAKHPRDKRGEFARILGDLKAGAHVTLPGGTTVRKDHERKFTVKSRTGKVLHTGDKVAAISTALTHDAKQQEVNPASHRGSKSAQQQLDEVNRLIERIQNKPHSPGNQASYESARKLRNQLRAEVRGETMGKSQPSSARDNVLTQARKTMLPGENFHARVIAEHPDTGKQMTFNAVGTSHQDALQRAHANMGGQHDEMVNRAGRPIIRGIKYKLVKEQVPVAGRWTDLPR